jgi:hypothetical protein
MSKYCKIFTFTTRGGMVVGGKARIVEGNFDTFAAVGSVRIDKNSLPNEPENWFFKELFVFDYDWARKWDAILYGKTDGFKTGIYFPVNDPFAAALVIDEELESCELVEIDKEVIKETRDLTRYYSFDGASLSIITTKV